MCAFASDYSTVRGPDPLLVVAVLLGLAALGLLISGLILATAALFVWLAVVIVALWLVSTGRHVIARGQQLPAHPALT
jgi:hypothetical protein